MAFQVMTRWATETYTGFDSPVGDPYDERDDAHGAMVGHATITHTNGFPTWELKFLPTIGAGIILDPQSPEGEHFFFWVEETR